MIFRQVIAVGLLACSHVVLASAPAPSAVVTNYANVAQASYEDALAGARQLQGKVNALLRAPDAAALADARQAWIDARVPYQQTEAFRFGNPVVDGWEGRVNAWPLDEGMIDYVDASYGNDSDLNAYYVVNVIANPKLAIGGKPVDASNITPELLRHVLHEADGNEANVATGYHAIEFLLWGQDLNGTGPAPVGREGSPQMRHAGNRPYTDFDPVNCTGGNCERRAQYLKVATDMLVADLEEMVAHWQPGGQARAAVEADANAGLVAMLTGVGSLSYGELAGERIKLGLILHDAEEEHDCFSDNTHNAHYYNQLGMMNVYLGRYAGVAGQIVEGPAISDLVRAVDPDLDDEMQARLQATLNAMQVMRDRAQNIETYDQMIGQGNAEGNAVIQAIVDQLVAQTRSIERVISVLKLGGVQIEGSDSLDSAGAVFK